MKSKNDHGEKLLGDVVEMTATKSAVGAHNVWYDKVSGNLFASCEPQPGTEIAYRLYQENELINSKTYQDGNFTAWQGLENGRYRVRFFRRSNQSVDSDKLTSKWVVIDNGN